MTPAIQTYFQSEKKAGMLLLALGILTGWIGGSLFVAAAAPYYIGLAIPLLGAGIFQIVAGTAAVRSMDIEAGNIEELRATEPVSFRLVETVRMERVMRQFGLRRWVALGAIVAGALLFLLQKEWILSKGLGLGLLIESAVLLLNDFFAQKRARIYQAFLEQIVTSQ